MTVGRKIHKPIKHPIERIKDLVVRFAHDHETSLRGKCVRELLLLLLLLSWSKGRGMAVISSGSGGGLDV